MTQEPDIDARSGQFAEACWAFKRGERDSLPFPDEFGLHPYLAWAIATHIGVDLKPAHKAKQAEQQQSLL